MRVEFDEVSRVGLIPGSSTTIRTEPTEVKECTCSQCGTSTLCARTSTHKGTCLSRENDANLLHIRTRKTENPWTMDHTIHSYISSYIQSEPSGAQTPPIPQHPSGSPLKIRIRLAMERARKAKLLRPQGAKENVLHTRPVEKL